MYPTVVILLVETQRSMTDVWEISPSIAGRLAGPALPEAPPATFRHLSFTVEPVQSMTDNEAVSQRSRVVQSQSGQEHGLEVILEVKESQASDRIGQDE